MAMNTAQYTDIPVFNALIPDEGPKCIPILLNGFGVQPSQQVDLQNMQSRGLISAVQSIYIDNSANAVALQITFALSNHVITCPPYSQGFFPALVPDPIRFNVYCPGGSTATLWLLNVPTAAGVWNTAGAPNSYTSGKLQVTDPILDAAVVNNLVGTSEYLLGHNGVAYPSWAGNVLATGSIGTTAVQTLATGNPGYFVTGFALAIDPGAFLASAGLLTVTLQDSVAGPLYRWPLRLPAAAPTLSAAASLVLNTPPGFVWNNKAANSTLQLVLSAALSGGLVYWTVNYGTTTQVG